MIAQQLSQKQIVRPRALVHGVAPLPGRSCLRGPRRFSPSVAAPEREVAVAEQPAVEAPSAPVPAGGDPWEDAKWTKYKWTVYRGVAYDLTSFIDRHPAGNWLIQLAIGRDCTALFESYHLRPEVAVGHLKRLPVLADFPVDAVPRAPYPNDSDLYNTIRQRVRAEIFKGTEIKGAHRSGSELAAAAILGYAVAAYGLYCWDANLLTGTLLGLAGAWIGLTVQHCGNHGAMSTNTWVNKAMGLCDDLIGGSSLMWRYHHQVSHHIHCNDEAFDEDVFSAFPLLRFDARLPRKWYHKYQHIYMWMAFPFLQLAFQYGDINALLTNRTAGATLYGADQQEKNTVLLGKVAHYTLLAGIPLLLHGPQAALIGAAAYTLTQSIVLSATFAVSHNVPESKPLQEGPTQATLDEEIDERDWGVQQVLTSANWGGVIGNFFTGGLNLQIEHHLFPAISFMHYPAISKIVADECAKRGIQYAHYPTLPEILSRFSKFMQQVGEADQTPARGVAAQQLARL